VQVLADHVVAVRVLQVLRPAAPPSGPNGSIVPWLVAALVLAVVVAGGVYLTSRR
jgi:hypothetical protein